MSDYSKSTNFTAKDGLSSGDPNKRINGSLFDGEFDPIATAVASKIDKVAGETGELAKFTSSGQLESAGITLAGIYPVGSIYMNAAVSTNPATLFGFGTWAVFGAGRVPVGIDVGGDTNFDAVEETGGSSDSIVVAHTHTGTSNSGGSHSHQVPVFSAGFVASGGPGGDATTVPKNVTSDTHSGHTHGFTTASTGSSGTDTNLQPYIVVYMWKRTA